MHTLTQTKAGRRFMGFMKAFNTGDDLHAYATNYITADALEKHPPEEWARQLRQIHAATGRLRVIQVVAADEYRVVVLMQAQTDSALYLTEMAVSEDYPHKIMEFIHRPAN